MARYTEQVITMTYGATSRMKPWILRSNSTHAGLSNPDCRVKKHFRQISLLNSRLGTSEMQLAILFRTIVLQLSRSTPYAMNAQSRNVGAEMTPPWHGPADVEFVDLVVGGPRNGRWKARWFGLLRQHRHLTWLLIYSSQWRPVEGGVG